MKGAGAVSVAAAGPARSPGRARCAFRDACEVIAPFLDPGNNWGGRSLGNLAFRAVRERFPELSAESVRMLVQVCMRRSRKGERSNLPAV
jgi:hypothetical protein